MPAPLHKSFGRFCFEYAQNTCSKNNVCLQVWKEPHLQMIRTILLCKCPNTYPIIASTFKFVLTESSNKFKQFRKIDCANAQNTRPTNDFCFQVRKESCLQIIRKSLFCKCLSTRPKDNFYFQVCLDTLCCCIQMRAKTLKLIVYQIKWKAHLKMRV